MTGREAVRDGVREGAVTDGAGAEGAAVPIREEKSIGPEAGFDVPKFMVGRSSETCFTRAFWKKMMMRED